MIYGRTTPSIAATGSVDGGASTGGLVGYNFGDVDNSYATGSVTASGNFSGGLAGAHDGSGHTILNCYATGLVSSGASFVGGLIGLQFVNTVVTSSYWNTETSGMAASSGGTGLTTTEMQEQTNFTGWDFSTVWAIDGSTNGGFPYLQ